MYGRPPRRSDRPALRTSASGQDAMTPSFAYSLRAGSIEKRVSFEALFADRSGKIVRQRQARRGLYRHSFCRVRLRGSTLGGCVRRILC